MEKLAAQGTSQSFEPEAHALEELQNRFQEEESEEDFLGFPEDSTGDEASDAGSWYQSEGSSSQESSEEETITSEDPGGMLKNSGEGESFAHWDIKSLRRVVLCLLQRGITSLMISEGN